MMPVRSCVNEKGRFIVGCHTPQFNVRNLREHSYPDTLGQLDDGTPVNNQINFLKDDVKVTRADVIYEIANPFPFRGTTYVNAGWADPKASNPDLINIPEPDPCSLLNNLEMNNLSEVLEKEKLIDLLPKPLKLSLAQSSTDPEELCILAGISCKIIFNAKDNTLAGLGYVRKNHHAVTPLIYDHDLFEALVNNPYLPDDYKNTMVLKPGVQGNNEIIGEYGSKEDKTHVFEYLRRNSYIPWGHFASNMANDAIRYAACELSIDDMVGLRHLYYQRAYARLAEQLGMTLPSKRECLNITDLETLRKKIHENLKSSRVRLNFNATLWGWNLGFGMAQSGHRLHASHQMIHQQNALIPKNVRSDNGLLVPSFACGDLISDFIVSYKEQTNCSFFKNYLSAIHHNKRTDGKKTFEQSLILSEDEYTVLFVPKAQVSEWELQLMPKTPCGNIVEADTKMRHSLDTGILNAAQTLEALGAKMVTAIEFSKRFDSAVNDHHLLYSFIPRLPFAPGTFSEAQLRWISGCYPEDFATACRNIMNHN